MEMGDLVCGDSHQAAGRGIVHRKRIVPNENRIHAQGPADDGAAAFQANSAINDAKVGRAKFVRAADENGEMGVQR